MSTLGEFGRVEGLDMARQDFKRHAMGVLYSMFLRIRVAVRSGGRIGGRISDRLNSGPHPPFSSYDETYYAYATLFHITTNKQTCFKSLGMNHFCPRNRVGRSGGRGRRERGGVGSWLGGGSLNSGPNLPFPNFYGNCYE